MVEGIVLRKVGPHDLAQINVLADDTLRENYSMELFTHLYETSSGSFFVAEDDGQILGFALAIPLALRTMRLLMLAVKPERQRTGLGRSLLELCMEHSRMRMMTEMVLEVSVKNENAIEFYRRNGFSVVSIIREYYNDGSDAYVMKRFLPM